MQAILFDITNYWERNGENKPMLTLKLSISHASREAKNGLPKITLLPTGILFAGINSNYKYHTPIL